jgi:hypothetical protein
VSVAQKIAGGVVVAMVLTAVLLPNRQTVPTINALTSLSKGTISTAEGTATG